MLPRARATRNPGRPGGLGRVGVMGPGPTTDRRQFLRRSGSVLVAAGAAALVPGLAGCGSSRAAGPTTTTGAGRCRGPTWPGRSRARWSWPARPATRVTSSSTTSGSTPSPRRPSPTASARRRPAVHRVRPHARAHGGGPGGWPQLRRVLDVPGAGDRRHPHGRRHSGRRGGPGGGRAGARLIDIYTTLGRPVCCCRADPVRRWASPDWPSAAGSACSAAHGLTWTTWPR